MKLTVPGLKLFTEGQENIHTEKTTSYDLKLFDEFFSTEVKGEKFKKFLSPSCKSLRQNSKLIAVGSCIAELYD